MNMNRTGLHTLSENCTDKRDPYCKIACNLQMWQGRVSGNIPEQQGIQTVCRISTSMNNVDGAVSYFAFNPFQGAVRTLSCSKSESVIPIRNNGM